MFGITVAIFASTALPFWLGLQTAMFAGINQKQMRLGYEFTDFHYKEEAEMAVNEIEAWLFEHQGELQIDSVYSHYAENNAATILTFTAAHVSEDEAKAVRERIRNEVPKIAGVELTFDDEDAQTGGDSTFFRVNLFGEDIERLALLAQDVERRLAATEGIEDARSSIGRLAPGDPSNAQPGARGQLRRHTADPLRDVRLHLGRPPFEAIQRGGQRSRASPDDVAARRLHFGRFEELRCQRPGRAGRHPRYPGGVPSRRSTETIQRENRKTQVSIRSSYEGEDWAGARRQIEESLNGMAFPVGYTWSFGERIQEQDRQLEQMLVNYLLALALIYIVMASQFESLVHPFAILFSIPFAFWGVAWFLLATRTPLNFMAQIGLLVLMGIVVKNGIVLIDHINNLRREGYDRETAIELGARSAFDRSS